MPVMLVNHAGGNAEPETKAGRGLRNTSVAVRPDFVVRFKGKHEDIRKSAETRGVTNVLEGSVRRAGSRVRMTTQLIHANDGTQFWSERYDRELSDMRRACRKSVEPPKARRPH